MAGATVRAGCWNDGRSTFIEMDRAAAGLSGPMPKPDRVGWNCAVDLLRIHPAD